MKVGLIDIDSKMPNLVLMKLSAYYKKIFKYDVELTVPLFNKNYDIVFASKIFSYSYCPVLPDDVNIGGSGFDLKTKLKPQVEHIMPDYDLYPGIGYSLGFTTRGCVRKCPFCIVPEKEGDIRFNADIYEFWDRRHKKIILLDNNIFALPNHFYKIADQILKEGLKIDFNQGLDTRLLTEEKAGILKELTPIEYWRFAFDNLKEEPKIRRGLECLKNAGFNDRHEIMFYLLIGFYEDDYDEAIQSGLKRIDIICNEYGFDVFAMPYNYDSRFADFTRWVNYKAIFRSVKWKDYNPYMSRKIQANKNL